MVRILSTGEIVADNDVRARQPSAGPRQNIGRIQHDPDAIAQEYEQGEGGGGGGGGGGAARWSMFEGLNQRLVAMGCPRFNIGSHTVEPIVSVGFLLAGLFLGLPGLLLAAMLFFLSKISTTPGGINSFFGSGNSGGRNQGPTSDSQGGYRLGNT